MNCESVDERLLEFLEDALTASAARSVRAHLADCPACRIKAQQTRELLAGFEDVRAIEAHAERRVTTNVPPRVGDFELLDELGRGGMGVVYRARQLSLRRIVALKILFPGLVQSELAVARFQKEARAAARLHHTNIVPIYAQGEQDGLYYFAMELVPGRALADALRPGDAASRPDTTAPGSLDAALAAATGARDHRLIARHFAEVAEALAHAHDSGVLHRDIKPQNLLVGPDGRLHISDFGLARLIDEPGVTRTTDMLGTPAYMAPEQIRGRRDVDGRADVYSLGATLYEVLTRRRPFEAATYERTMRAILDSEPRRPQAIDASIPTDLDTIVMRALEKEPARRFSSAAEFAADLRRFAQDHPIRSRRIGPVARLWRSVRRRPALASSIAAVCVILVLIPLLRWSTRGFARARAEAAWNVLLEDYRDSDRALAELGWLAELVGDDDQLTMLNAFAHVRESDGQRSFDLLAPLLEEDPRHADAHFLMAWVCARMSRWRGESFAHRALEHIERGRKLEAESSAAGWFFCGQALTNLGYQREASQAFDEAIRGRANFTQAMLHKARALNRLMYFQPHERFLDQILPDLLFVRRMQPARAYPRYLLSNLYHQLAEYYAVEGRVEDARTAYTESLAYAREAQQVEPASARGYAAEAECHESRATFLPADEDPRALLEAARNAWSRLDDPRVNCSTEELAERAAYTMRLAFWLDDYAAAERMRRARFADASGYAAESALHAALIDMTRGRARHARATLDDAIAGTPPLARQLLFLDMGYRLLGQNPPDEAFTRHDVYDVALPAMWSESWLRALVGYQRGRLAWDDLMARLEDEPAAETHPNLLLAAAHLLRGVRLLSAGEREPAQQAFMVASRQNDLEQYCFVARLLEMKLRLDAAWPNWSLAPPP